jgi:Ca2+-binding EF-hand superfamily protein
MHSVVLLFLTLTADGPAQNAAAAGPGAAPTAIAAPQRSPAAARAGDLQDVVLLLDQGPLQMRLHLAIGGVSLGEARRAYVHRLFTALDLNKDGRLSRDESQKSPLFRTKSRPSASAFLDSLRAQTSLTPRDVETRVEQKIGQLVAYRDDKTSSKNDLEVFKLLDADKSGVLDTSELVGAEALILLKDEDGDDCISFQEFFPPPPPPDPMRVLAGLVEEPEIKLATVSELVRNVQEPSLPQRLRIKYDKSPRDRELSAAELSWPAERVKLLDASGNGTLNDDEVRGLVDLPPDVVLTVDLAATGLGGGVIQVEGVQGKRLDDGGRPDYAKISFPAAVMTFSHRNRDPLSDSLADAMRKFNELDADANGYLDKDETMEQVRFQRELFELIDADGDSKIFADEMKLYVAAFSEPTASNCRMQLYDTGYGFFMALDGNADGRVSRRERLKSALSLAALDRDGKLGIAEKEPVRHVHVEFTRATYKLFSASEELVADTPAFQRRMPTGPIWFQRMDKNNDGDLVWNEFLGHIETFHQLDTNGDDMLDPEEAAKYKAPAVKSN